MFYLLKTNSKIQDLFIKFFYELDIYYNTPLIFLLYVFP